MVVHRRDQDHVGVDIRLVAEILRDDLPGRGVALEDIEIELGLAGFRPSHLDANVFARGGGGAEPRDREREFVADQDSIASRNAVRLG